MNKQNNSGFANFLLHIAGILLCIVPPAVCTLLYFPFWKSVSYTHCIAGGGALILVLCLLPLYKLIIKATKSASSYLLWLVMFLLFVALSKIGEQMTVISFVGFVGNLLGAICFRLAGRKGGKEED